MGENGPEPDCSRKLSGHPESLKIEAPPESPGKPWPIFAVETLTAWSGPWGVSFTANLTPDVETGLGRWTLQNFNVADFESIYAFLRSIPPVRNRVPEPLSPATQEM